MWGFMEREGLGVARGSGPRYGPGLLVAMGIDVVFSYPIPHQVCAINFVFAKSVEP